MSWNGSGTYVLPAASFPEVNGTTVDATRFNNTLNDVATGVTAALAKNGENAPTANLPMATFKHTGVGDANGTGQYIAYGQATAANVGGNWTVGGILAVTGTSAFTGNITSPFKVASRAYTITSSQAFTATPTFDASLSNVFEFSGAMTANVTSCTISNAVAGQTISIRVKQDGTGSRTFASPAGAKILGSIGATASAASILTLTYSAMDSRWEGAWTPLPV